MQRQRLALAKQNSDASLRLKWDDGADKIVPFSDLAQRALEREPDAELNPTRWRDGNGQR